MTEFSPITFDRTQCRKGLDAFEKLLTSKKELTESKDIQPLFKKFPQLAAFLGTLVPGLLETDRLAYEFGVFGDYTADLVVGNAARRTFCAVEFEDARPGSVLRKVKGRAQKEWGPRLEHGFSQLIDWFFTFDDHKNSAGFTQLFGEGHVEFYGMLLVGRVADLTAHDCRRLGWRSGRVTINTHKIFCSTYDELMTDLNVVWKAIDSIGQGGKP